MVRKTSNLFTSIQAAHEHSQNTSLKSNLPTYTPAKK